MTIILHFYYMQKQLFFAFGDDQTSNEALKPLAA